MADLTYQTKVLVIGAGLAGITTSLELIEKGHQVLLLDAGLEENWGGQAKEAFGGMLFSNTPEQKRNGIADSNELFWQDWQTAAAFKPEDRWAKRWAKAYVEYNSSQVYDWLKKRGISFFPVVQWVERGKYGDGNSVPRYHLAWGCGQGLVKALLQRLNEHPNYRALTTVFSHQVIGFSFTQGRVTGCFGNSTNGSFSVQAEHTVICSGGINGNLDKVRQHWDPIYGPPPKNLLSGAHPSANGALHDQVEQLGGEVRNLNYMWNYAAGVAHPKPAYPNQGLSLIPPRSALWLDCYGRRLGPEPLITGYDTHDLCKQIGHLPQQYTWQVMNKRIADKELAISGSDTNPNFRDKKLLKVIWQALKGNSAQTLELMNQCVDVVSGQNLGELAAKMQELQPQVPIDLEGMTRDIASYDAMLKGPKALHNDDQIRRLNEIRQWRGDRLRTCKLQPIVDAKHLPLIALRLRLISRKSMGGLLTDLQGRVLNSQERPLIGLYAAGEAAGFGGGGIAGIRSLEGTFLSNCIFNGRRVAQAINAG
ncbi:FAD-binding dehydrogenase [Marinospirillum insulare]|uniref:FAD-binding dehydrogenase n=1 Tax=Marinospirillum insulare TaxID=217169 RepID=A0ABQ5ZY11_9GAMM|nr:FAD-binding dehydrogenase [Marinospirillum insulare]GLR62825.1 FAD-binding dehydrogenase [Marinospirillum insulare]